MSAASPSPASTLVNLQAELDDVVFYINEYQRFRTKLGLKLWLKSQRSQRFRPDKMFMSVFRTSIHSGETLSGKTSDFVKSTFASASDSDKRTEFYDVCCSDYELHALALKLLSRFPNYEFQKLAQFHDSLEASLQIRFWQVLGFVVAAASFMLKDLPENVVRNQFGMDYSTYEAYVFWAAVVVAAYLLIVFVRPWYVIRQQQTEHRFIGKVLRYTALL